MRDMDSATCNSAGIHSQEASQKCLSVCASHVCCSEECLFHLHLQKRHLASPNVWCASMSWLVACMAQLVMLELSVLAVNVSDRRPADVLSMCCKCVVNVTEDTCCWRRAPSIRSTRRSKKCSLIAARHKQTPRR